MMEWNEKHDQALKDIKTNGTHGPEAEIFKEYVPHMLNIPITPYVSPCSEECGCNDGMD